MHYVRESPLNYGETNITVYMRGGVNIQVALEASIESHLGFPIALMKCTASEFAACDRNWFFFVSLELYQTVFAPVSTYVLICSIAKCVYCCLYHLTKQTHRTDMTASITVPQEHVSCLFLFYCLCLFGSCCKKLREK